MFQDRLNGLAMTIINKKEKFKKEDFVQIFAQNTPRTLQLANWGSGS